MKVLISDDDKEYGSSLSKLIVSDGIDVTWVDNWEDAFSLINESKSFYDVVILDGKGKLNADSASNDQGHLIQAHTDLVLLKKDVKVLDYVINTGFSKEFEYYQRMGIQVFRKPQDQERLITYLKNFDEHNDLYKIKKTHIKAFDACGLLSGATGEEKLFRFIKNFERTKGFDFTASRNFLIMVLERLQSKGDIPKEKEFVSSYEAINIGWSIRYIAGEKISDKGIAIYPYDKKRKIVPYPIKSSMIFIKDTTSAVLHNKEPYSDYTSNAVFYATLDILVWFNNYFKKHND